jgi:hypothetical protein
LTRNYYLQLGQSDTLLLAAQSQARADKSTAKYLRPAPTLWIEDQAKQL